MKRSLQNIALLAAAALIFIFILFVDTTFYHVPSFIRIYRYEREIAILVAFLFVLALMRKEYQQSLPSVGKTLKRLLVGQLAILVLVFLPQVILRKYMVLWGNNPFLADNPMSWNILSSLIAIGVTGLLLYQLFLIAFLNGYREDRFHRYAFQVLIAVLILMPVLMNIFEDRYSYEPIEAFYLDPKLQSWTVLALVFGIFACNAVRRPWLDRLNNRQKWITFLAFLVTTAALLYCYLSRFMLPVFTYSVAVKWFVIPVMGFVVFYGFSNVIGLLLRLPTSAGVERLTREMEAFAEINRMISRKEELSRILDTVARCAMTSTRSDVCWLELLNARDEKWRLLAAVELPPELRHHLEELDAERSLTRDIRQAKKAVLITDVLRDSRAKCFQLLDVPWRSFAAVPMIEQDNVRGIMYVAKKARHGYRQRACRTIEMFMHQIQIALQDRQAELDQLL